MQNDDAWYRMKKTAPKPTNVTNLLYFHIIISDFQWLICRAMSLLVSLACTLLALRKSPIQVRASLVTTRPVETRALPDVTRPSPPTFLYSLP